MEEITRTRQQVTCNIGAVTVIDTAEQNPYNKKVTFRIVRGGV